jgi:hypothetical protein
MVRHTDAYGTTGRNAEIRARARNGESLQSIADAYGISRQRVEQIINASRHLARQRLKYAIARGDIVPATGCQMCGANDTPLDGHHADYEQWDRVIWVCSACHGVADAAAKRHTDEQLTRLIGEELLTTREGAARLGVSTGTISGWQKRYGKMRRAGRRGRSGSAVYRVAEFEALYARAAKKVRTVLPERTPDDTREHGCWQEPACVPSVQRT